MVYVCDVESHRAGEWMSLEDMGGGGGGADRAQVGRPGKEEISVAAAQAKISRDFCCKFFCNSPFSLPIQSRRWTSINGPPSVNFF